MKFGKYFEEELIRQNVPQEWIDSAIQYKALKKRIHRFTDELRTLGLSKETLKVLLESAASAKNSKDHGSDSCTRSGGSSSSSNSNADRKVDASKDVNSSNETVRTLLQLRDEDDDEDGEAHLYTFHDTVPSGGGGGGGEGRAGEEESTSNGKLHYNLNIEVETVAKEGVLETPMAKYFFAQNQHYIKPKLVIFLTGEDVHSKEIKQKIGDYITGRSNDEKVVELVDYDDNGDDNHDDNHDNNDGDNDGDGDGTVKNTKPHISEIKLFKLGSVTENIKITISLDEDDKFFQMIFLELDSLQKIKELHQQEMVKKIEKISKLIGLLSSPSKFRTDMDSWREIFEMYLDNRIFFVTDDMHGERDVLEVGKRLDEFSQDVVSSNLVKQFKHKRSKEAFYSFYQLNLELLRAMRFQHLNKLAIDKILKKFDKQTALAVKTQFPRLISKEPFINESFVTGLYAAIAERLVMVVPQLDDYNCPVCLTLAYKPIKLQCQHVFCVQCLINLQRQKKDECPVCRKHCVLKADSTNLDMERLVFMKRYFPKQVKAKVKERARELEKERYARALQQYDSTGCVIS